MPRPPVDIQELKPDHEDSEAMARAINELSRVPVHRGFRNVKTISVDYEMDLLYDRIILCDAVKTITLPPAADADHVVYTIVRIGVGTVSVACETGLIDGVDRSVGSGTPLTITTIHESISVASDDTNYFRVDNNS